MLKNYDIVCFGPSDWWGMNPSCGTHIMRHLSQANRVLYINPVSSDLLGMKGRSGLFLRIVRKSKSLLKWYRKIHSNLYVVSPLFVPIQGVLFFDRLNNLFLKQQLRLLMFLLKIKNPLLWVENIRCADVVPAFNWRKVIYHVSDRFDECPYTKNKQVLQQREAFISKNADLLICVSRELFNSKKANSTNVHYLPHGVDFSRFRQAADKAEAYPELAVENRPIAGYFGTLTEQNDIDLLTYCAQKLPSVKFVFVGHITAGDYSKLQQLENVQFLGKRPYKDIPTLCVTFDVCLLPWKLTRWIANCNPLKLFEYMASGKPIVSVPINEVVDHYSDLLSIAGNKEEFCQAIEWELNHDTDDRRQKRIDIARLNSWDHHVDKLSDLIKMNH